MLEAFHLKLGAILVFETAQWELANPYTRIHSRRTRKKEPEQPVCSDCIIVYLSSNKLKLIYK